MKKQDMKYGILIISKCALESSTAKWLNDVKKEVQDIHCGCKDCENRAVQIFKETGKIIRKGQNFTEK